MDPKVKKFKQTCTCKNCGNEAEMIITCTLEPVHKHPAEKVAEEQVQKKDTKQKIKGSGTCTQCGNEADIWVEI